MTSLSRRGLIGKAALLGGSILLSSSDEALAATVAVPAALGEKGGKQYLPVHEYKKKNMSSDFTDINCLSKSALDHHYDHHYCRVVARLNALRSSIAKLPPHTPPFLLAGLKKDELTTFNSLILHELYFENLGASGQASSGLLALIAKSFGSLDSWRHNFKLAARSFSGRPGWLILCYCPVDGLCHNVISEGDNLNLIGGQPLLVLDLFEHAYQKDFGSAVDAYVEAFFEDINWAAASQRLG